MNIKEKTPKLPLTNEERKLLRKYKIKLAELKFHNQDELSLILDIDKNRAKELIALALFQSIPSIGPQLARNVVNDLGFYNYEEIRNQKGEELIIQLKKKYGVWMDPCVEDGLRCVVHHAKHPNSDKNWWDFTEERKAYRNMFGYPDDRPTNAWHA